MQTHDMITDCDHGRAQDLLKAWQDHISRMAENKQTKTEGGKK
jgi:hypothetical protein